MKALIIVFSLLLILPASAGDCPTTESFFAKLSGEWLGVGRAIDMVADVSWEVAVETSSHTVTAGTLHVSNRWAEKRVQGEINYILNYVFRVDPEGCFGRNLKILMSREASAEKTKWISGLYDGRSLVINQELYGGYSLLTQTVFNRDTSAASRMLLVKDGSIRQRIEVLYRRLDSGVVLNQ